MTTLEPAGPAVDAARLRVLTMNVYGPGNPDWERRLQMTGRTIRELDPDVVALQEVPVDDRALLDRLVGRRLPLHPVLSG